MKNIMVTMSVEEINLVLTSLGHLPFNQVHQVIFKIQSQAEQQLRNESPGEHFLSDETPSNEGMPSMLRNIP